MSNREYYLMWEGEVVETNIKTLPDAEEVQQEYLDKGRKNIEIGIAWEQRNALKNGGKIRWKK